jgi:peptidoglycan-associated lipoprotein
LQIGKTALTEKIMNRAYFTATVIVMVLLVVFACAKKKIVTDPDPSQSYASGAQDQTDDAAASSGQGQQTGIGEATLTKTSRDDQSSLGDRSDEIKAFENADILFEFDSAQLTMQAQEILRDKAQYLQENPDISVTIEGHCDDRGTNEYNLALGERRALSAQAYLITLGVAEPRLNTVSYGEESPLVPGTSDEAREKNRRAHFVVK